MIQQYSENYPRNHTFTVPSASDNFGKMAKTTTHFLAGNQPSHTQSTEEKGSNTPMHYKQFAQRQKLCTPRPSIKSMADYQSNKVRLNAIKKESKNIPQIILPEYIQQLPQQNIFPLSGK
ncbi:hypothetical protein BHC44_07240 [Snodgrassella alvi]|jgi:hypothetical protein|uniref:Uncharacterized protein n=1 Tax=Snodgrassella alvi TaxID=1196083 RepID=A0A2N9XV11_9NEIS|nr:hypothetical protein [Snodgrassella alvi]PIT52594.1 hypothetical protein BHC44_07240 [Snodgrassella alvi]PIT53354.1 hypothetical protein BHC49_13070 [Snodgrassella alvi]